jgi:hypothetical protein
VLLFDGKSLDGWTTSGSKEAWRVADGSIVTGGGGDGWWLRTTRQYRDFELKLDFQIPKDGNSGVGLRSSTGGDPAFTGMEVQILDTAGQQPGLTNCGAVYDAIAPKAMAVKPPGEWNTYTIRLVGDTIDATLNGVVIHAGEKLDNRGYIHTPDKVSPLRDRLPTGYIALQEHGNPAHFRNIKIHNLSPDPDPGDFKPLFNGKDLAGWNSNGMANWSVDDGAIVGHDGPGHLFTDRTFKNFELRAQVRVNANGNGGLYFRAKPKEPTTTAVFDPWPLGYEAQVDQHDPKNFTGCIYDRAWPAAKAPITRDEAWFDYRVRADGDHIQTWINGQPMTDAHLSEFAEGHIALQSHHPGNVIMWKDIEVRDVSTSKP